MSEYIYETQGEQVIGNPKGFILPKEEIVRCVACKYYSQNDGLCYRNSYLYDPSGIGADIAVSGTVKVGPDGFCAWSLKREDKEK